MHAPFNALGIHSATTCGKLKNVEDSTINGHGKFRLSG
jgi:hypothetical protein